MKKKEKTKAEKAAANAKRSVYTWSIGVIASIGTLATLLVMGYAGGFAIGCALLVFLAAAIVSFFFGRGAIKEGIESVEDAAMGKARYAS